MYGVLYPKLQMTHQEKKYLALATVGAVTVIISQVIVESGADEFSGWDGLGRAVYVTLLVTIPAAALSFTTLSLLIISYLKRRKT